MPQKRLQTLEAAISMALLLLIVYILWVPASSLVWLAAAILVLALFAVPPIPWLLKQWMRFLHGVGVVNTKILLGLIFFGVLTPIAFVYRLFTKKDAKKESNFVERNHSFGAKDFEHTF
ncbi:SxtJ family membrane protein [Rufibacter soli]|jgi:hypothetical protein